MRNGTQASVSLRVRVSIDPLSPSGQSAHYRRHWALLTCIRPAHRFASLVADKDVPTLLLEVTQPDGSLPFEVLPIDKNRAAVREFAKHWLNIMGALWLADQADLLPWDTTPYGSLAEREAAQRDGVTKRKKLLPQLYDAIVAKKEKNKGRKAPVRVEQDVALRRVLGLSSWDAAKELKQKTLMRLEKVPVVPGSGLGRGFTTGS